MYVSTANKKMLAIDDFFWWEVPQDQSTFITFRYDFGSSEISNIYFFQAIFSVYYLILSWFLFSSFIDIQVRERYRWPV